jgi:hypothetical protein
MKTSSNSDCVEMHRGVRKFLAEEFPEVSTDIALLVLLRIAVDIAVRHSSSKERAPVLLSRLINEFLITDHYE